MKNIKKSLIILLTTLSLTSCSSEKENITNVQEAGLSTNGLSTNGLSTNGLSTNGLSTNGLSTNGLSTNGLLITQLSDPYSQQLLKYIVSCALKPDQQVTVLVDGSLLVFNGEIGLAPGWGDDGGSCDSKCQSWVSGCLLSRLNYLGENVIISMRGDSSALKTSSEELLEYNLPEATYYGNLFTNPTVQYACTINGSTLISRVCGPTTDGCFVNVLGDCLQYCDGPDTTDGHFSNCRDLMNNSSLGSVTVYRN